MHLLFVYGTLKRGFCRSAYLGRQRFIGIARTVPEYKLYDLGEYPGMVWVGDAGIGVDGELYEVDSQCLAILDRVEDIEHGLYQRCEVRLQIVNRNADPLSPSALKALAGQVAIAYLFNGSVAAARDIGSAWQ